NDRSTFDDEVISISRRINKNDANNFVNVIWGDGFGNPILSKEIKNGSSVFHFYSRFNPEWNGLPWSPQFPELLFSLILDRNKKDNYEFDRRIIHEKQMEPILANNQDHQTDKFTKTTDLSHMLWVLSFVTFFIESL